MTRLISPPTAKQVGRCLSILILLGQASGAQSEAKTKTWKSPSSGLTLTVTETLIGTNSSEIVDDSFLHGPDGKSVVYMTMSGGAMRVHHNNVPGAPFDGISPNTLHFSPDGKHLSYVGIRDNKNILVLDDKEYTYEAITEAGVQFSPDSQHAFWVIKTNSGKQALVLNGIPQAEHDGVSPDGITFSPDGMHYVYQVNDEGQTSLVYDGTPGPRMDEILDYGFSPSGSRLGHIGIVGEKKLVFIDAQLVAEVDGVGRGGIRFSANGERYFLAVHRGGVWSLLIDGTYEGEYEALIPNFKVRHDGQRYAYLASTAKGSGLALFVDGKQVVKQKGIQSMAFNPVSDDLGYVARNGDKSFAVIDGVQGSEFDSIERTGIIFSPDGKHYAYSARNGTERFVVLDGVASKPMERYGPVQPTFLDNGTLVYTAILNETTRFVFNNNHQSAFSKVNALFVNADSSRHTYIAFEGTRRIAVVDGKRDGEYARIPRAPLFSDNGKHYAYVGHTGSKHEVVLNGSIQGTYDYVMERSLNFSPDSKHLIYLAALGPERMLVMDDIMVKDNYTGFLQLRNLAFTDQNRFFVRASRGNDMLLLECEFKNP